jgi:hypothetical protein
MTALRVERAVHSHAGRGYLSVRGRFDPFAKMTINGRYLRFAAVPYKVSCASLLLRYDPQKEWLVS